MRRFIKFTKQLAYSTKRTTRNAFHIVKHDCGSITGHTLIRPMTKSTFGVHDPLGLRYLFQLRVNLCPLRSHKRQHNFSDTPSDVCECNLGIEDIRHFLIQCTFYAAQRVTLSVSVIDILQRNNLNHLGNQPELYLYGHPTLTLTDNRQILLSKIKYIKDTKRLSGSVP